MPFGISSAPEFYQRVVAQIIENIDGSCNHIDDILVFGETKEQHDIRLEKVLRALSEAGVTLNEEKCQFGVHEVRFLGHVISKDGIKVDPEKVRALIEYKTPDNVNEVRRFLGMVNYLMKFIPNLALLTKPLRELVIKGNEWTWGSAQITCFEKIKKMLTETPVLAHFNPNKDTRVSADSSAYGLGAMLEQFCTEDKRWKVVTYTSRSLTKPETKWAQIEKEALALTWACRRFDMWVRGMPIRLVTDHKPLVAIFGHKQLDELTPRLQRLKMIMMRYNYDIVFVPGKEMYVPDALSRAPVDKATGEFNVIEDKVNDYVAYVRANIPILDERVEEVRKAQAECRVSEELRSYVVRGWPCQKNLSEEVRKLYPYRAELAVIENLIVKGENLYIPKELRERILDRIHEGHLGITKCLRKASATVWWPDMRQAIIKFVLNCRECTEERSNSVEPLIPTELPEGPWEKVAADIFTFDRRNYLCIIDYFSRFPEVVSLERLTAKHIIERVKSVFSRYGIPMVFRCDQGTAFVSREFLRFGEEYGFKIVTSSPRYPKSNGFAERGVQTLKGIMKRNKAGDLYLGLLAYRSAPNETGFSPGELLMGRQLRTCIPRMKKEPRWPERDEVQRQDEKAKWRQKYNYDRRHRVKDLLPLENGQKVWVTDWKKYGEVVRKEEQPRSYQVKLGNGAVLQRNRFHLIPVTELHEKRKEM